jgi:hypothetical protein
MPLALIPPVDEVIGATKGSSLLIPIIIRGKKRTTIILQFSSEDLFGVISYLRKSNRIY